MNCVNYWRSAVEYKSTTAQFGELCAVVDLQSRRYDSILQLSCTQSLTIINSNSKAHSRCSWTKWRAESNVPVQLRHTIHPTTDWFVDESSFNRRTAIRGHAWVLRGQRAVRKCFFVRGKRLSFFLVVPLHLTDDFCRYSLLPALSLDGILHASVVEGSFERADAGCRFCAFLLLPMVVWCGYGFWCQVLARENKPSECLFSAALNHWLRVCTDCTVCSLNVHTCILHINPSGAPFVIILKALYHWLQVYLMPPCQLILRAVWYSVQKCRLWLSGPNFTPKMGRPRQRKMDDISLRNHVDSLRFHEDMARTKLFIKMLISFEKHATANYSANGNNSKGGASLQHGHVPTLLEPPFIQSFLLSSTQILIIIW